jgi:hypothetical protein
LGPGGAGQSPGIEWNLKEKPKESGKTHENKQGTYARAIEKEILAGSAFQAEEVE